jgi:hypothetical protein
VSREAAPDCRCDHTARAHEHHTLRENCAVCDCPDYRPPTDWAVLAVWAALGVAVIAFWAFVGFGVALWRG